MEKNLQVTEVYKDNELSYINLRYRKPTRSGFIWIDENIEPIPDVISIEKASDYEEKSTFCIRAYGEFKKIFQ